MKIARTKCRAFRLPLKQKLVSSRYTLTHRELVLFEAETEDGRTGVGWCTTGGVGAAAVQALIAGYLAPTLLGEDPRNTERVWQRLWLECHAAGAGGLTTLALAAIDIALWDLKAKAAGEPLHRLLGGARTSAEVYASGINLHLTQNELVDQVRGHLAQGYRAFKLKIGRPGLREDTERCLAVREAVGDGCQLMVDANQKWSVGEAVQRLRLLAEVVPLFVEEPLLSDDVHGYRKLRDAAGVPVAMGEQLCNRYDFWNFVGDDAADFLQPDVCKVGGITEFLRIAALAASANVAMSPHGSLELSAHLAAALPNVLHVENIFGVNLFDFGATSQPLRIVEGRIAPDDTPGHGVVFDGPSLEGREVAAGVAIDREPMVRGQA